MSSAPRDDPDCAKLSRKGLDQSVLNSCRGEPVFSRHKKYPEIGTVGIDSYVSLKSFDLLCTSPLTGSNTRPIKQPRPRVHRSGAVRGDIKIRTTERDVYCSPDEDEYNDVVARKF